MKHDKINNVSEIDQNSESYKKALEVITSKPDGLRNLLANITRKLVPIGAMLGQIPDKAYHIAAVEFAKEGAEDPMMSYASEVTLILYNANQEINRIALKYESEAQEVLTQSPEEVTPRF